MEERPLWSRNEGRGVRRTEWVIMGMDRAREVEVMDMDMEGKEEAATTTTTTMAFMRVERLED